MIVSTPMLTQIATPFAGLPMTTTRPRLIAAARRVPAYMPFDVLRLAPPTAQRIGWQGTEHDTAFSGWDAAAEIVAYGRDRFASIKAQSDALFADAILDVPRAAMPRLVGGFAFRDDFAAAEGVWSAFPAAYFMLPRVQYTRIGDEAWLTVSQIAAPDESLDMTLSWLNEDLDHLAEQLQNAVFSTRMRVYPRAIQYPLTQDAWRAQVSEATRRIRAGELEKVVLSRYADITFDAPVDPLSALDTLNANYPTAYRFLVEVYPGHAFFGATPELMAAKRGVQLDTAALAGSRPRGSSEAADRAFAAELLASAKEQSEHGYVVDALRDLLRPFARTLHIPDAPTIMRLRNIQHLYTPIQATLDDDAALFDIIAALHPTPALGGSPRRGAMDAIRRLETTDRGWYAAPIGWIDADGDGVFAVAIRSAVSAEDRARLYAGAGIVADSDPDREWDETALKFKPLMNALGATGDAR
jgi:menaquinone-specific isochorismate synthase